MGVARRSRRSHRVLALAASALTVAACAHPPRGPAVPMGATTDARIPGIPDARYWTGEDPAPMLALGLDSLRRKRALADVGFEGDAAALGIGGRRSLPDCIRGVRRRAMQSAVRMTHRCGGDAGGRHRHQAREPLSRPVVPLPAFRMFTARARKMYASNRLADNPANE